MIAVATKGPTCSGTQGTFVTGFDGSWLVCRVPDQAEITVRANAARYLGRPLIQVVEGACLSDMSIHHNTGHCEKDLVELENTTRRSEAKPR